MHMQARWSLYFCTEYIRIGLPQNFGIEEIQVFPAKLFASQPDSTFSSFAILQRLVEKTHSRAEERKYDETGTSRGVRWAVTETAPVSSRRGAIVSLRNYLEQ